MKKNNPKTTILQKNAVYLYLLLFSFSLYAQTPDVLTVKGQITDGAIPIPGATIQIKGASRGTVSDFDGHYEINAQSNDTLLFSYIGYTTVQEPVGNRATISVTLQQDATTLREVVINAGYYTVKDRERTGSISRVTAKEIEQQPVNNPLEALQGRMPGVSITQNSGVPGGGFEVRIRGQNSIVAGNQPLYVIDGIPYDASNMTRAGGSVLSAGGYNPLNFINPSDIKSVEVLKDADATAIYGSRGANGVVLITTKQGKSGKTKFSVQSNTGTASVTRFADLMNTEQYMEMRREAFQNDGIEEYPVNAYDINGTWDETRNTDWQNELIGGTAKFHNLQANVSGGNKQTQFVIGGAFRKETTVFRGDYEFERGTAHTKVNHQSENEKFSLLFSANYGIEDNFLPSMDPTNDAWTIAPNAPELFNEDGSLNWEDSTWTNPLAVMNNEYQTKRNSLSSSLMLNYKLGTGVNLQTRFGYTDTRLKEFRTFPNTYFDPAFGLTPSISQLTVSDALQTSWIVEPQINWLKKWDNATLNVSIGGTLQERNTNNTTILGMGFPNNNLIYNLSAASDLMVLDQSGAQYRYAAGFTRVNYNLFEKYIINVTGRRDGSSRFGSGNKFANFGAIGMAWLFAEESFLQNALPFVSFGKLRASYGTTGNDQIGDYQYLNTYSITGSYYNGSAGLYPAQLFNPDFAWETNKKLEFALEVGWFNNRLNTTVNYYNNRSSNQLVGRPLPGTTGFSSIQDNLNAIVENTGWEFDVQSVNLQNNSWKWTTAVNVTIPRNKLVDFPGLEQSTYANRFVIGKPLNSVQVYHLEEVNPETGLFEFTDYNNDGEITPTEDKRHTMDLSQRLYGGVHNSLTYKNWGLDVFFQFVKQNGYNQYFLGNTPGLMLNQPADAFDRWQQPGDIATMQRYTSGADPEAVLRFARFTESSGAISDASFIRLKNIALNFNLPLKEKVGFECKVFLKGQNLITWTKFKGDDPEQLISYLPPLKRFTVGVEFKL